MTEFVRRGTMRAVFWGATLSLGSVAAMTLSACKDRPYRALKDFGELYLLTSAPQFRLSLPNHPKLRLRYRAAAGTTKGAPEQFDAVVSFDINDNDPKPAPLHIPARVEVDFLVTGRPVPTPYFLSRVEIPMRRGLPPWSVEEVDLLAYKTHFKKGVNCSPQVGTATGGCEFSVAEVPPLEAESEHGFKAISDAWPTAADDLMALPPRAARERLRKLVSTDPRWNEGMLEMLSRVPAWDLARIETIVRGFYFSSEACLGLRQFAKSIPDGMPSRVRESLLLAEQGSSAIHQAIAGAFGKMGPVEGITRAEYLALLEKELFTAVGNVDRTWAQAAFKQLDRLAPPRNPADTLDAIRLALRKFQFPAAAMLISDDWDSPSNPNPRDVRALESWLHEFPAADRLPLVQRAIDKLSSISTAGLLSWLSLLPAEQVYPTLMKASRLIDHLSSDELASLMGLSRQQRWAILTTFYDRLRGVNMATIQTLAQALLLPEERRGLVAQYFEAKPAIEWSEFIVLARLARKPAEPMAPSIVAEEPELEAFLVRFLPKVTDKAQPDLAEPLSWLPPARRTALLETFIKWAQPLNMGTLLALARVLPSQPAALLKGLPAVVGLPTVEVLEALTRLKRQWPQPAPPEWAPWGNFTDFRDALLALAVDQVADLSEATLAQLADATSSGTRRDELLARGKRRLGIP